MKRAIFFLLVWASVGATSLAGEWLRFRGDDAGGVVKPAAADPSQAGWQAKLPDDLKGVSSPLVVGGRVIISSSSGYRQDRLHLSAYDLASGKLVWQRQFWATGRTMCHPMTAVAAPTPASDGKSVVALYSSGDLVCFNLDGNMLWTRPLGLENPAAGNDVGMSSSPIIVDGAAIVQWESQGGSFATAVEMEDGRTRWLRPGPRQGNWTSPIALTRSGSRGRAVILQSAGLISTLDPENAATIWSFDTKCNDITSATTDGSVVYVPTSAGLQALKIPSDGGKLEPLWQNAKLAFGAASPVVADGRIYTINRAGVLVCGDAKTGQVLSQTRLKGAFWASPIISGERMYVVSREGLVQTVKLGEHPEPDGEASLSEEVLASPALVDGWLVVRSSHHLWKIPAGSLKLPIADATP